MNPDLSLGRPVPTKITPEYVKSVPITMPPWPARARASVWRQYQARSLSPRGTPWARCPCAILLAIRLAIIACPNDKSGFMANKHGFRCLFLIDSLRQNTVWAPSPICMICGCAETRHGRISSMVGLLGRSGCVCLALGPLATVFRGALQALGCSAVTGSRWGSISAHTRAKAASSSARQACRRVQSCALAAPSAQRAASLIAAAPM